MKPIILLLMAVALVGCQMDTPKASGDETTSSISIANMAFDPGTSRNVVGKEITFTNKDSASHTIVWDQVPTGADKTSSKTLSKGGTYRYTPTVAGTYTYHCGIHPLMKGTLVIN